MPLSNAHVDSVELRRERVAHLRLQGMSARDIADALAKGTDNKERLINPDTNQPYTHTTILSDLKVLNTRWRKSANIATDEHAARQFAEIQEIKRLAWTKQNGELALKAIDKEMKLLGTMKQPDGITINVNMNIIAQLVEAIESRGESAGDLFEELLRDIQLANSDSNQS